MRALCGLTGLHWQRGDRPLAAMQGVSAAPGGTSPMHTGSLMCLAVCGCGTVVPDLCGHQNLSLTLLAGNMLETLNGLYDQVCSAYAMPVRILMQCCSREQRDPYQPMIRH